MRRGEELRHHILLKAKDVFLELGFKRASMDAIAERADTTKRTLYAHFENKEQLFLALIDVLGDLLRQKVKSPSDYADDPVEAMVLFCGRFQRMLVWGPAVRMCRLFTARGRVFPRGSSARLRGCVRGCATTHGGVPAEALRSVSKGGDAGR